ncbi:MAG: hypothetical protein JWP75_102 [Frondihabitans sp.]|nr:hypothetical protein [Frondihabitans sp.]
MARAKKYSQGVEAPRLDVVDPQELEEVRADLLGSRQSHDAELLADADLTDVDLEGSSFTECSLERLVLGGAKLRGSRFIESVIIDSFAPALSAPRTTWRDVRVDRPRWGSAEIFDSELQSVRLEGGKIDYLNFRESTLHDVVIESCSIGELDLGGVVADRVALIDCRIGSLDVTRARLSSFDLRSSTFDGVSGLEGLRGVVIDDAQLTLLAPALARHVGLIVE